MSAVLSAHDRLVLPDDAAAPDVSSGTIQFIGTATVLLRFAGFTVLTDPNFLHRGDHVRLGYGLRSTRRTSPALEIDQLPPLDLVLLSHLHEDHFDRVAERRLDRDLPIVTTRHAAVGLRRIGFHAARALDTWRTQTVAKGDVELRITAMPGKHGPGFLSALLPPVMGSMLEFATPAGTLGPRIYISGDTLVYEHLREIPRRYPEIDLALLHLGGTRVLGMLVTMDARQGLEALRLIRPRLAIPIHYNDYTVFKSPLQHFQQAVAAAGLEQHVRYLGHGARTRSRASSARPAHGPAPTPPSGYSPNSAARASVADHSRVRRGGSSARDWMVGQ
jgi:L-ascorbate metabolism protein UlaG (beta-lactamase superfamily)